MNKTIIPGKFKECIFTKLVVLVKKYMITTLKAQIVVDTMGAGIRMANMKRLLLSILCFWSLECISQIPHLTPEQKAYLEKQGLPIPGSGLTIVDSKKDLHLNHHNLIAYNKAEKEQKTTGYIHERNDTAINLLKSDQRFEKELTRITALQNRRLQSDISTDFAEIKMAYPYKPIANNLYSRFIAFAPTGVYIKEKPTEGWAGITEYFHADFAPCSYEEVNIKLTGSASIVSKDTITHDVNGKITEYMAIGDEHGYLYQVEWNDENFRRILRCASKEFSEDVHSKLIDLANHIDLDKS